MDSIRTFPVLVAIHNISHGKYHSGWVHNEEILREIIEMCTQSNTYYTISYNREETTLQLTHEDNRETKEPDAELQSQ